MTNILNIVKNALKGDNNIEIEIPLSDNFIQNILQSTNQKHTRNLIQVETSNKQIEMAQKTDLIINDSRQSDPVACDNVIPDTEVAVKQQKPVAEDLYPKQTVPQPINYLEEITNRTNILKVFNRYGSELEKINSTLVKQDDQQNINDTRYNLSRIQPIPLSDDTNFNHSFPLYALPTPYQNLVKAVAQNLNVPIEAVAPALLCAVYISGRGQFKIQVKPDYFESFTEYFIVVQHSGENKSAIVRFFRSVFEKFNEGL